MASQANVFYLHSLGQRYYKQEEITLEEIERFVRFLCHVRFDFNIKCEVNLISLSFQNNMYTMSMRIWCK